MKCILLVRVSTESQNFDEQERELIQLARRNGYEDKDIVSIAEKESGIRLSEEERHGLNRMKEFIATEEFDCVFAWEVSRIARKKKVLFSILEYLVDRKIQLVIKEPYLHLLKPDGTIDEGSETVFTLYSQIAETEMRNKMARFSRAKREGFEKGKYMGGKILLGYKVNEAGYWEVDEEDGKFVRLIFELYNTGDFSMTELAKEVVARGYFKGCKNITNVKARISHILKNDLYIGHRKSNNKFPKLIDDETWNKTVARRKENHTKGAKKAQRLLSALIRCKCGGSYCANLIDCCYECRVKHNSVEKGLEHSLGINLNMAESLAWYVALCEMQNDMINQRGVARDKYNEEIKTLEKKISVSQDNITSVLNRRKELDEAYFVSQHFTKERYDDLTKMMNERLSCENNNIATYKAKIKAYERQIEYEVTFDDILTNLKGSFEELKEGTDIELMIKIVKRYIKEVRIEEIPGKSSTFYKKVIFDTFSPQPNPDEYAKLGLTDLLYINTHTYYVNTHDKKAFFDSEMQNEVPMSYMEREHRRRIHKK